MVAFYLTLDISSLILREHSSENKIAVRFLPYSPHAGGYPVEGKPNMLLKSKGSAPTIVKSYGIVETNEICTNFYMYINIVILKLYTQFTKNRNQ